MPGAPWPGPVMFRISADVSWISRLEVRVEQVETGLGAPMTEQAVLDVLGRERATQQRVLAEIELGRTQITGGAPVRIHLGEALGRRRVAHPAWPAPAPFQVRKEC